MDLLGIGSLIKGGVDIAKMIKGGVDYKKGKKEVESALDNLKYTRPEEYAQLSNLLKQRESSIPTRREAAEDRIRRGTTTGTTAIRQLSDSPVAALTAYGGLKARETQAISQLEEQFERMRDEAVLGQVSGLEMGAQYSDKEQYWNEMYKQQVRANMGANRMGAGTDMMWGGAEGLASTGLDYLGTKYLSGKLNPQQSTDVNASAGIGGTVGGATGGASAGIKP